MFSVIFFIHIVMHSIRQALRVYLRHWHFSILNLQNASEFFPIQYSHFLPKCKTILLVYCYIHNLFKMKWRKCCCIPAGGEKEAKTSLSRGVWSLFPLNSISYGRTCDHSWSWETQPRLAGLSWKQLDLVDLTELIKLVSQHDLAGFTFLVSWSPSLTS